MNKAVKLDAKNKLPETAIQMDESPSQSIVDREPQVNNFKTSLEQIADSFIRQGSSSRVGKKQKIFEWYGAPGIGKSTLVDVLARTCYEKEISWALERFGGTHQNKISSEERKSFLNDPSLLTLHIAKKLISNSFNSKEIFNSLQNAVKEFQDLGHPDNVIKEYYQLTQEQRIYTRPDWVNRFRRVTAEFVKLLIQLGEQKQPVVIFFDETEYAEIILVDWIEEWIIAPLTQLNHVLIVWTARRPWRWKRPEVNYLIFSEELLPFNKRQLEDQFRGSSKNKNYIKENFFAKILDITGGHPYANQIVIDNIEAKQLPQKISIRYTNELLGNIYNQFIRNYVLKSLGDQKLLNDVGNAINFMSLVRLFDVNMLQKISVSLSMSQNPQGQKKLNSITDFNDILFSMRRTQLLVWNRGFSIEPSIRHLIWEYYRYSQEPEERRIFIKANESATEMYQEWLSKAIDNRSLFVVELIYHLLCLRLKKKKSFDDILSSFRDQVKAYRKYISDKDALQLAYDQLQNEIDHDKSLGKLLKEQEKARLLRVISE